MACQIQSYVGPMRIMPGRRCRPWSFVWPLIALMQSILHTKTMHRQSNKLPRTIWHYPKTIQLFSQDVFNMVICWTWITILTWVGQYVWNGVFLLSWILTSHFLFYSPFVFSCFKWFLHLYEGREAFPRNYSHLHFMMGDGEDNFPPSKKIRIAGRELFRDYLGWYWTRDWDFKESE